MKKKRPFTVEEAGQLGGRAWWKSLSATQRAARIKKMVAARRAKRKGKGDVDHDEGEGDPEAAS